MRKVVYFLLPIFLATLLNAQDPGGENGIQYPESSLVDYQNTPALNKSIGISHNVTFDCQPAGRLPANTKIQWRKKDNLQLPPGTEQEGTRLHMFNATYRNNGSYICEIVGDDGLFTPRLQMIANLKVCPCGFAVCAEGGCIPNRQVCDGHPDCSNDIKTASDEGMRCICEYKKPSMYACSSDMMCYERRKRCDNFVDCEDGSDEVNCGPSHCETDPSNPDSNNSCGNKGDGDGGSSNEQYRPPPPPPPPSPSCYGAECPDPRDAPDPPENYADLGNKDPCPQGFKNEQLGIDTTSQSECISCFCFGMTTKCQRADLFKSKIKIILPLVQDNMVTTIDVTEGHPLIHGELNMTGHIQRIGQYSVQIPTFYSKIGAKQNIPYLRLPKACHGHQLNWFGGYLKYTASYKHEADDAGPVAILRGNGHTLIYNSSDAYRNGKSHELVTIGYGEWYMKKGGDLKIAKKEDHMMVLANVTDFFIKGKYGNSGQLNVVISNIIMLTTTRSYTELGAAFSVEKCSCPNGYTGNSCEHCAPGYFGNPSRNIPCKVCPCPLTNPENQSPRTCHLGPGNQPICDCPPGYIGTSCESCASGHRLNGQCLPPNETSQNILNEKSRICHLEKGESIINNHEVKNCISKCI